MMQTKVIGLISKPSADRSSVDIQDVLPWVRKKSELFSHSKNDVLYDIIRNCDYRRVFKDEVIVTQGDQGECFYILLSGKTSVYIDTSKSDEDSDLLKIQTGGSALPSDQKAVNGSLKCVDDAKTKSLERSVYGKFMRHLEPGKSFGEIALISEDSVRNATIIADVQTDLLLIHSDLFNRSMKIQQEKEYAERKEFIEGCCLFSDWSSKFKNLLEMSIRKEVYPPGSHIMKQGEPVDGLFFMVSGQAKVTTQPSRHSQQYPHLDTTVSVLEKEFGIHIKENKKTTNGVTQDQIRVRRKEGYAAAEKRHMFKSLDLCCVEGQEIQGDIEVVMEMSTCACTVTCTAETTVFLLDLKSYDRLIVKKNIQTIIRLKQGVHRKMKSRMATSNGGQVPFLKSVHDKLQEELKPRPKSTKKPETTSYEKKIMLSQMIKLYLKDKTPLIGPLLPDSFSSRILAERRNKSIQRESEQHEDRGARLRMRHRMVPRSMKQLQNSCTETQLMHPSGEWLDASTTRLPTRPRSAGGNELSNGDSKPDSNSRIPDVYLLTECDGNDQTGQKATKETPVMITHGADHVFNHLDAIHREKSANRSKMIYSAAAKNELKSEIEATQFGNSADGLCDIDDNCFDYETSPMNVNKLELKIKQFCELVNPKRNNEPLMINGMKSFTIKNVDTVPTSGGTVFVNRVPCSNQRGSEFHKHVRRFMITRETHKQSASASSVRAKSALPASLVRPKTAW